jgi:O-antigen ligase
MKARCPNCGLALERGEHSDFWIGAYVFNLAAGEVIAIGIPAVWMIASAPRQPWVAIEIVAGLLCVALPILFFPFSRTLWLAWDLSFRPQEPGDAGVSADVNAPRHPKER